MDQENRRKQAKVIRVFRRVHRLTGLALFIFFFILGITGILLGWKKNTGGFLLADSYNGSSAAVSEWLSIDSLQKRAELYFVENFGHEISKELDRIDFRPDKGMVKFIYKEKYLALQLDTSTGDLLHVEKRRADFIEQIHDGTIVDKMLGLKSGQFKLFYTSIMGLALITFTITGFWLWYGPKRMQS